MTSRRAVYLHVGEPKSGTTFLQQVMWHNRGMLAREGVLLPGLTAQDHFRATQDLREVTQAANDPAGSYRGEWDVLARQASRADGVAVVSHELLAGATAQQAARARASLAGAELHVVVTVRDFVSLLPAEWQETVKHRNKGAWQPWVRHIMTTEQDVAADRPWFWQVHDTLDILRRWADGLPPEQVHVVTVPPPGSPHDLLWQRFASVLGVPAEGADLSAARPNTSLGLAEAELLRRLNVALPRERIPDWYYAAQIKEALAHEVLAARPADLRPRLTPAQEDWARARADKVVAELVSSGYDIVGSVADLRPRAAEATVDRRPGGVPAPRVLDAAVDALATVLLRNYDAALASPAPASRVKRALRNFAARHPRAIGRVRVLAWRLNEGTRARRR